MKHPKKVVKEKSSHFKDIKLQKYHLIQIKNSVKLRPTET